MSEPVKEVAPAADAAAVPDAAAPAKDAPAKDAPAAAAAPAEENKKEEETDADVVVLCDGGIKKKILKVRVGASR